MLKVQVLGKGLIPRMGRLAPIEEPMPMSKNTVGVIFQTSKNFMLNYLDPTTNKLHPLTRENYLKIFDKFDGTVPVRDVKPAVAERVVEQPVVEEKQEELVVEPSLSVEEKLEENVVVETTGAETETTIEEELVVNPSDNRNDHYKKNKKNRH